MAQRPSRVAAAELEAVRIAEHFHPTHTVRQRGGKGSELRREQGSDETDGAHDCFRGSFFLLAGAHADALDGLEEFAFRLDAGSDDDFGFLKFADGAFANV